MVAIEHTSVGNRVPPRLPSIFHYFLATWVNSIHRHTHARLVRTWNHLRGQRYLSSDFTAATAAVSKQKRVFGKESRKRRQGKTFHSTTTTVGNRSFRMISGPTFPLHTVIYIKPGLPSERANSQFAYRGVALVKIPFSPHTSREASERGAYMLAALYHAVPCRLCNLDQASCFAATVCSVHPPPEPGGVWYAFAVDVSLLVDGRSVHCAHRFILPQIYGVSAKRLLLQCDLPRALTSLCFGR